VENPADEVIETVKEDGLNLQSDLLKESHRKPLRMAMKQLADCAGPETVKNLLEKKWKKLFSFKSDDEDTKVGLKGTRAWEKMLGPGPHLIVQRFNDSTGQEVVSGVFIQGKMPDLPAAMPESDGEQAREVEHMPGDFCFLYAGN
jgi:hypothetical protein